MFYQHNFEQFVGNLHDPNQLLIDLKKLGVLHEAKVLPENERRKMIKMTKGGARIGSYKTTTDGYQASSMAITFSSITSN